jgi:hypothetical protein
MYPKKSYVSENDIGWSPLESTQRFKPGRMLCCVNWSIVTNVSEDSISHTFRVKKLDYDPSEHW